MITEDLRKQILFINELEKLKLVYRQNGVLDKSRPENSAEHSWHIALMAILLQEHSSANNIDILKVVKMLLIHDIVEIDTGDTFLYDEENRNNAHIKEEKAALRIFGLLPKKQQEEFIALWNEFEKRKTPEAQFAASMDGLQPLLNRLITTEQNENPHKMTKSAVINNKKFIKDTAPQLWEVAEDVIEKSVDKGLYIDNMEEHR